MNRRKFIAGTPALLLFAGCQDRIGNDGNNGTDSNDNTATNQTTPTASFEKETGQYTVTVVSAENNQDEAPPFDLDAEKPEAEIQFDCENSTATVTGWMSSSGCRDVSIRSISYDDSSNRLSLVIADIWGMDSDPAEIDCGGASYEYEVRVKADSTLPGQIRLIHENEEYNVSQELTADKDC